MMTLVPTLLSIIFVTTCSGVIINGVDITINDITKHDISIADISQTNFITSLKQGVNEWLQSGIVPGSKQWFHFQHFLTDKQSPDPRNLPILFEFVYDDEAKFGRSVYLEMNDDVYTQLIPREKMWTESVRMVLSQVPRVQFPNDPSTIPESGTFTLAEGLFPLIKITGFTFIQHLRNYLRGVDRIYMWAETNKTHVSPDNAVLVQVPLIKNELVFYRTTQEQVVIDAILSNNSFTLPTQTAPQPTTKPTLPPTGVSCTLCATM
eukprot:194_1